MSRIYYTQQHEWFCPANGHVGITSYAQEQMGDVVFVELPGVGHTFEAGAEVAVVESVKAASEVYAPVGGTVQEVNTALVDHPELVNDDPENKGWIFKLQLRDDTTLDSLMDSKTYLAFLKKTT